LFASVEGSRYEQGLLVSKVMVSVADVRQPQRAPGPMARRLSRLSLLATACVCAAIRDWKFLELAD
jgi:hypothetical protein